MDEILYYTKEADYFLAESYHDFLTCYSNTEIFAMESCNGVFMESSIKELAEKVKETIDKIIKAISDFFKKATSAILSAFAEKDAKKKLEELEKANVDSKQKVTIVSSDKEKEKLNKYIQEMTKLERELIGIRGDIKANRNVGDKGLAMIEYEKVSKKIDELNAQYDKEFLDANVDTIELAAKDAIRFSKKQLDTVKVDFEALEKEHTKILQQYKKDADGCDVPVKSSLLAKIANSVGTRIRRFEANMVKYRKKNIFTALAISFAAGVVSNAAARAAGKKLAEIGNEYMKKNGGKPTKIVDIIY